ncbi:Hypothetical protein A7982_08080 [Minicystis rosea]|nr:Hypothetical protein A7982_08080 [Minicystis rosea]
MSRGRGQAPRLAAEPPSVEVIRKVRAMRSAPHFRGFEGRSPVG